MNIVVKQYKVDQKAVWNEFLQSARNATFLFDRNYMDYHSDRFHDFSLMFYNDDKLIALLPANRSGNCVYSHQGLTYGGLVTSVKATTAIVLEIFEQLKVFLRKCHVEKVVYKAIPWIYHSVPAEEDLYALFKVCHAHIVSRDISSSINMLHKVKWHHGRKYGINRCINNGVHVETDDKYLAGFWKVLTENLQFCYGAHPVHSLEEMKLLKERFPKQIVLYSAIKDEEVIGGVLLYITSQVVHTQYISASPVGKHLGAIDAIINRIVNEDYLDVPYFDFGKSTEQGGQYLNESLIWQKEGFGARGVCYDCYEWDL